MADLRRSSRRCGPPPSSAGVRIVTGDTKVVPRGKADRIFINTSGIGVFDHDLEISGNGARPGDKVLINGTIGDHGMAVLASREGLELSQDIRSDSAALNGLVADMLPDRRKLRPRPARPDPRRRRHHPQGDRPAVGGRHHPGGERPAGSRLGRRRLRHPRPRPPLRRQRRQASRRGRPRCGRAPSEGDARASPRTGGGRHRRGLRRNGGQGLPAHRRRRPAVHRDAGRRTAAADLLRRPAHAQGDGRIVSPLSFSPFPCEGRKKAPDKAAPIGDLGLTIRGDELN